LLKPEVGLNKAVSAMGATPPVWNKGRPVLNPGSDPHGKPPPVFHTAEAFAGSVPYNVGRTRARAQLKLALKTEEEETQLRRLQQALDSNRFDQCLSTELDDAARQARELARKLEVDERPIDLVRPLPPEEVSRLEKIPKPKKKVVEEAPPPQEEEASPEKRCTISDNVADYFSRQADGGSSSAAAEDLPDFDFVPCDQAELAAQQQAATRIQAIHRGNHDRHAVQEKKEAAGSG